MSTRETGVAESLTAAPFETFTASSPESSWDIVLTCRQQLAGQVCE